jgi:hypothetical protein
MSNTSRIPTLKDNDNLLSTPKQKAAALNRQYQSVFTEESPGDITTKEDGLITLMANILFTKEGVEKLLKNIDPIKASGPDNISTKILKETDTEVAPPLAIIFQHTYDTGQVPNDWRNANITAIFKKGSKVYPSTYRPMSLTNVVCKIMEHIIFSQVMKHLNDNNILVHYHHGFRSGHSCETQLLTTIEDISRTLDMGKQVDMMILDFSKAFDTVPHRRLLMKLDHDGIRDHTHEWIRQWLTTRKQRVVLDGEASSEVHVDLGPLMYLLYVNDIGEGVNSEVKLFADDCLLYRTIASESDTKQLQEDLSKMTEWSNK